MPRKSLPALLTALLLALPALAADRPAADPAQLQTDAYVALAQAEAALDANRPDDAAALFRQALDTYNAIARDYPDFSAATIRYRSTYCQNQLADLEARLGVASRPKPARPAEPAPAPAAPSSDAATAKPSSRAEHELNLELAYLRSRLASLEAELTQADETESSLNSRIQLLQMETNRLARALDERADATQEDWERLLADRDEARAALDDANRRLAEADSLRPALDEAETQAAELRTRLFRLQQENETLSAEAADLEKDADEASARAMRAEARIVELEAEKLALQESLSAAQTASAPRKPKSTAPSARPVHLADATPAAPAPSPAPEPAPEPAPSKPAQPAPAATPPPAAPATPPPAARTLPRDNTPPRPIPPGTDPAAFVRQLLADGENKAALATIRQARLSAPDDLNLALIEGIALIRLDAYDDASALLIPLARANPKHAEIRATLGAAMMGAGDYDQARDTLEEAVKLDKKLAEAHYNLALLYAFAAPVKEKLARRHYREALSLGIDPDPNLEPFR